MKGPSIKSCGTKFAQLPYSFHSMPKNDSMIRHRTAISKEFNRYNIPKNDWFLGEYQFMLGIIKQIDQKHQGTLRIIMTEASIP